MAEKKQAAPVETVKQPEAIEQTYEVKPNQTTSIVNGNDVLFFGKDVVKIIVVTQGSANGATSASKSAGLPRVPSAAKAVMGEDRGD